MAANGFTAVRTHADVTIEHGLTSIEALLDVRKRVADVIDIEIVALCGWPVTGTTGADQRALLRTAMQMGADLVGGVPHLESDHRRRHDRFGDRGAARDRRRPSTPGRPAHRRNPRPDRRRPRSAGPARARRFRPAGDREPLREPGPTVDRRTGGDRRAGRRSRDQRRRPSAHEPVPPGTRARTDASSTDRRRCAAARRRQRLRPEPTTCRIPFNPLGRACPFETAGPDDPHHASASRGCLVDGVDQRCARSAGRRRTARSCRRSSADLLSVPAETVREAIANAPADRWVWRGGHRRVTNGHSRNVMFTDPGRGRSEPRAIVASA